MRFLLLSLLIVVTFTAPLAQAKNTRVNVVFASEMPEIHGNNNRYAKLATLIKDVRGSNPNTFFFFGGGSLGPSILSAFDQGSHIIDLLNSLEPDAMGISKREFSFYPETLSLRAYDATFPFVATNILEQSSGKHLDGLVTSTIAHQHNVSIGFLSIIDDSVIEDYTFKQIGLLDPKTVIEQAAVQLRRKGADVVILQYTGYHPVIYQLLEDKVIDLSMHKDEIFDESLYVNRKYHANDVFVRKEQDVAVVDLVLSEGRKPALMSFSVDYKDVDKFKDDPQVARQISGYISRLKAILDVEIGSLGTDISTGRFSLRTGENAFGNYIADSIKLFANAQLAIINSGSIRGNRVYITGTKLTRGTIVTEMPFRGKVVLIKLTGKQLYQAFENGFGSYESNKGRFPQVAGIKVVFDSSAPIGQRVKSISLGDKPVKADTEYRVATTDYLAGGGDGYDMFKQAPHIADKQLTIRLVSDIVMDRIMEDKVILPTKDGRLVNLKSKN